MVVICLLLLCGAGGLLLTGIVRDSDIMVGSSIGLSLLVALLLLAGLRGSKTTGEATGSGETGAQRGAEAARRVRARAEDHVGDRPGVRTEGRDDDAPTQIIASRSSATPSAEPRARGRVSAGEFTGEPGRADEPATEVIGSPEDETVVGVSADRAADRVGEADRSERADDGAVASVDDDDDDDYPDPPDEPAIEPVLPGERDRVAGIDVEVAVVDGRPRYHLTDCSHLDGKDAEPLLASEAVELGFTPCIRCRPVRALLSEGVSGARGGPSS